MHWDLHKLFRRHSQELLRFLRRNGVSDDVAPDLMQDAFLRLASAHKPGDTVVSNPRAYLFQVSRNLVIDHARSITVQKRVFVADVPADIPAMQPSPETEADFRQRMERLGQAVAQLPARQREVFLLHKFDEMTHSEIAVHLGISKSMVEKHMIKALIRLRESMDDLLN